MAISMATGNSIDRLRPRSIDSFSVAISDKYSLRKSFGSNADISLDAVDVFSSVFYIHWKWADNFTLPARCIPFLRFDLAGLGWLDIDTDRSAAITSAPFTE